MPKQISTIEYIKSKAQSFSTEDMLAATLEFIEEHVKAVVEVEDDEVETEDEKSPLE